jgi:hypothetical protein
VLRAEFHDFARIHRRTPRFRAATRQRGALEYVHRKQPAPARKNAMLSYVIFGIAVLCVLNVAAHAGATRGDAPSMGAIVFRWLPKAVGIGTASAFVLGGLAFLLSLAAN